jgi:hypothetical protein
MEELPNSKPNILPVEWWLLASHWTQVWPAGIGFVENL